MGSTLSPRTLSNSRTATLSRRSFRITGLDSAPFRHRYGLSDAALAEHGAERHVAGSKPGFPDRIEMRDGEPGEAFLLFNHVCQPAPTPYRATHAIVVRGGAIHKRRQGG